MNGANIGSFDLNTPADSESMGLADDRMRSIKSTFQQALDDEHAFPSGGGSAVGYHRFGSARPYYGVQSNVSSSGTDGRLMQTSDTSRLFHVGSGGTSLIGGPGVVSIASYPGGAAPQRHYWVEEVGASRTDSSGSTVVTFPNSGFSGVPYSFLQQYMASIGLETGSGGIRVETYSATAMTIVARTNTAAVDTSGVSFFWRSIGTRAL